MSPRARIRRVLALALALALASLAPAGLAEANRAYQRVAAAYAEGNGQLDPCLFTTAQLEAALAGIPRSLRGTVPQMSQAMRDGIAAHERGDCRGRTPGVAAPSGNPAGGAVPPPEAAPGASVPTTPAPATTTAPAQAAPTPATTPAQPPADVARDRDSTPLLVALVAAGTLILLALATWGWARVRGWDPTWVARTRHAWGEAGYRTTSTWSEFTDWLRLGR